MMVSDLEASPTSTKGKDSVVAEGNHCGGHLSRGLLSIRLLLLATAADATTTNIRVTVASVGCLLIGSG